MQLCNYCSSRLLELPLKECADMITTTQIDKVPESNPSIEDMTPVDANFLQMLHVART